MRTRPGDIPRLLLTPEGRWRIRTGLSHVAAPVTRPFARLYRRTILRRTRIVAVIGSFGKTTTRKLVASALDDQYRPRRKQLVKAIFSIPVGYPHAVFEVGIEASGQMHAIAKVLAPDITVVTTIGTEHMRSMGTLERNRHEKAFMVRALGPGGLAILNGDDPNVMWMASQTHARVVTYGLGESNAVRASDISLDWPRGLVFTVHAHGASRRLRTRFVGRHMVLSFLASAAVATAEGFSLDHWASRVEDIQPVGGRMRLERLANGAVLLCDYFKSSYETMQSALDALAEIPARRRIVVFGDVAEPPGSPATIYGGLGERIGRIAQKAVFVGEHFRRYRAGAVRAGMPRHALVDAGRFVSNAVSALDDDLGPGDVVLIKGRQEQRLDRVALALQGRTVGCRLVSCWLKEPRCAECSMLENGEPGRRR